jgi:sodium transport system ATP-binding protein
MVDQSGETLMIDVRDVSKSFKLVKAVSGLSFAAEDGHITGLLGPNGAGKTTTLRMLSGLTRPDLGEVLVDGMDVGKNPQIVRQFIGMLPHTPGLYQRLTAREHIDYFGQLRGLTKEKVELRTTELSDMLDMTRIIDRRTDGFSQGEKMKVAQACALVHEPRNVILDEPTNGLDVMSTRAVRSLIRSLKDQGHCILFSSHIMQEVAALCDTVVIIAQGRVMASGTPQELLERVGTTDLEEAFLSLASTGGAL